MNIMNKSQKKSQALFNKFSLLLLLGLASAAPAPRVQAEGWITKGLASVLILAGTLMKPSEASCAVCIAQNGVAWCVFIGACRRRLADADVPASDCVPVVEAVYSSGKIQEVTDGAVMCFEQDMEFQVAIPSCTYEEFVAIEISTEPTRSSVDIDKLIGAYAFENPEPGSYLLNEPSISNGQSLEDMNTYTMRNVYSHMTGEDPSSTEMQITLDSSAC